ncbi:hypothetical protein [Psychroserpens sp.]|uniref:hypothetical protein n=1 Tax=Psychroserpens sp. TaxID=2020870 RepID=UPI00385E1100
MKTVFKTTLLITLFGLLVIFSKSIQIACIEQYESLISFLSKRTNSQVHILTF